MGTIKVTKWEELDGTINGNFIIKCNNSIGNRIQIRLITNSAYVGDIMLYTSPRDIILSWLKIFGFPAEFITPRKLTKADYHMAQALYVMYPDGWVAQNESNDYCRLFKNGKPTKSKSRWLFDDGWDNDIVSNVFFPFITFADEQPYSTKELAEMEQEDLK